MLGRGEKAMQIIRVSQEHPKGYGGRPMAVGSFTYEPNEGRSGHFIGYATIGGRGYKICAPGRYFENVIAQFCGEEFEVKVSIEPKKEDKKILARILNRVYNEDIER